MTVKELEDKETFDTFIKSNQKAVVDFSAQWCGPCKFIGPKFHDMSAKFPNIAFGTVDVDENQDASEAERISAMPTFIIYKDGVKVGELTGASEPKLLQLLEKLNNM